MAVFLNAHNFFLGQGDGYAQAELSPSILQERRPNYFLHPPEGQFRRSITNPVLYWHLQINRHKRRFIWSLYEFKILSFSVRERWTFPYNPDSAGDACR